MFQLMDDQWACPGSDQTMTAFRLLFPSASHANGGNSQPASRKTLVERGKVSDQIRTEGGVEMDIDRSPNASGLRRDPSSFIRRDWLLARDRTRAIPSLCG